MGLYNFKPQFVPFIKEWSKRHTIRAERSKQDLPGKVMHLFQGLRHPGAECLMRTRCVRRDFLVITEQRRIRIGASVGLSDYPALYGEGQFHRTGFVDLDQDEENLLAWKDGFRPEGSTQENPGDAFRLMMQFWNGRLPFQGQMYHWDPRVQFSWPRPGRLIQITPQHPFYVKGAAA